MGREGGSGSPLEYLQQAREKAETEAADARRLLADLVPKLKDIAELDTKLKTAIDYLAADAATKQDTGEAKGTTGNTLRTIENLLAEIQSEYASGNDPRDSVSRLEDLVESTISMATAHAVRHIKKRAEEAKEEIRVPL